MKSIYYGRKNYQELYVDTYTLKNFKSFIRDSLRKDFDFPGTVKDKLSDVLKNLESYKKFDMVDQINELVCFHWCLTDWLIIKEEDHDHVPEEGDNITVCGFKGHITNRHFDVDRNLMEYRTDIIFGDLEQDLTKDEKTKEELISEMIKEIEELEEEIKKEIEDYSKIQDAIKEEKTNFMKKLFGKGEK
ncbi:hypothetical protein Q7A53_05180 [Halobacillus rhizosphaerae]|uniref:hypothetical protein n=1 Tax=Halobacillus rhizosphaerae TaxID=3064889 RepID=UPI00398ADE80